MNINWYGQTCFKINVQINKNQPISILINPFLGGTGLRSPKADADIILLSHPFLPAACLPGRQGRQVLPADRQGRQVSEKPGSLDSSIFLIDGPGEYDVKGVYIQGVQEFGGKGEVLENTIYIIEAEDIKICHLGLLLQNELSSEELNKIGEIDILMLPIGNKETIGPKEAVKIMSQIEPKITIPMYYRVPNLKTKLEKLDGFLNLLGIKSLAPVQKLSMKKKDLPAEEAKIVVLEP